MLVYTSVDFDLLINQQHCWLPHNFLRDLDILSVFFFSLVWFCVVNLLRMRLLYMQIVCIALFASGKLTSGISHQVLPVRVSEQTSKAEWPDRPRTAWVTGNHTFLGTHQTKF